MDSEIRDKLANKFESEQHHIPEEVAASDYLAGIAVSLLRDEIGKLPTYGGGWGVTFIDREHILKLLGG